MQRSLVELSEGFADSAMSEMSNIDTKVRAGTAGGVRGGPGRGVGGRGSSSYWLLLPTRLATSVRLTSCSSMGTCHQLQLALANMSDRRQHNAETSAMHATGRTALPFVA